MAVPQSEDGQQSEVVEAPSAAFANPDHLSEAFSKDSWDRSLGVCLGAKGGSGEMTWGSWWWCSVGDEAERRGRKTARNAAAMPSSSR